MPAVSVLMKPSSSMCNMSCDYCFYCDEAEKRSQKSFGFMSEQTLKKCHPPDDPARGGHDQLCLPGRRAFPAQTGFF